MSSAQNFRCLTAFGNTLDSALIFAVDVNEWRDPKTCRTHILQISNGKLKKLEVFEDYICMSWFSEKNGTAYCPTNGKLYIYQNDSWRSEPICDRDVLFNDVFGFSSENSDEDILFVTTNTTLLIRENGAWTEHPMPDHVEEAGAIHGISPDQIYICGGDDILLLWNGKEIEQVEGPEDSLYGPLVISDDEMLIVGELLHRWSSDNGWEQLDSPQDGEHLGIPLLYKKDELWFGTFNGVLRYSNEEFDMISEYDCSYFFRLKDAVLGIRSKCGLPYYHNDEWHLLDLNSI